MFAHLREIPAVDPVHGDSQQHAFAAGKWMIDTVKRDVPIWKKENWTDGGSEWVHPGIDSDHTDAASAELS